MIWETHFLNSTRLPKLSQSRANLIVRRVPRSTIRMNIFLVSGSKGCDYLARAGED